MDFNLNDFSGIGREESQFMDQSNADINNVFNMNREQELQVGPNIGPEGHFAVPQQPQQQLQQQQAENQIDSGSQMQWSQAVAPPLAGQAAALGGQGSAMVMNNAGVNMLQEEGKLGQGAGMLVGLDDVDVSRISMRQEGAATYGQGAGGQAAGTAVTQWRQGMVGSYDVVVEEDPQSSHTHIESSQAASTVGAASMSAAPSSTTEWKKPKFQKKKRGGAKNQKNAAEAAANANPAQDAMQPPPARRRPEALQPEAANEGGAARRPKQLQLDRQELDREMYRQAQNRRAGEVQSPSSPVPLPLFECLYCVGIHEHLALQTSKERSLTTKYGRQGADSKATTQDQNKPAVERLNDSDACDFYEEMHALTHLLDVNTLASEANTRILAREIGRLGSAQLPASSDPSGPSVATTSPLEELRILGLQNELGRYCLLGAEVAAIRRSVARKSKEGKASEKKEAVMPGLPLAQERPRERRFSDEDEYGEENLNMISNLLDNFEEIDPEEQSMFLNLNIRNRRQKLLHNMSFETDCYDIYDPQFTSEEENSSSSGTGSSGSSNSSSVYGSQDETSNSQQSSQDEDDDPANGDRRRQPPGTPGTYNNGMPGQFDAQGQRQMYFGGGGPGHGGLQRDGAPEYMGPDEDDEPEEGSITQYAQNNCKMNDTDLLAIDYDSENNHSSLSSIHREIAPVTEMGIAGIGDMSNFGNGQTSQPLRYNQPGEAGQDNGVENLNDDGVLPAFTQNIVQTFSASGGCQVEEMRDDTVVNRCNILFQSQVAKAELKKKKTIQAVQKQTKIAWGNNGHLQMQSEAQKYPVQGDDGNLEGNEDESIIRILPGLPSGMVTSAADVKHEVDSQSPSHIGISADNSRDEDEAAAHHAQKLLDSHIVGLTTLDKEQLSPVRTRPSFNHKNRNAVSESMTDQNQCGVTTIQIQQIAQNVKTQHELRLRQDENGDGSNLDSGNEIQIRDLGNNIVPQQNIFTDASSSAHLSDLQMVQERQLTVPAQNLSKGDCDVGRVQRDREERARVASKDLGVPDQLKGCKKIVSANMSIISSIYNNQSRDVNEMISQGQLSQSSHQSRRINLHSPVKYRPSGANQGDHEQHSARNGQSGFVQGSMQKETKKRPPGSRQLSSGLEIDFYNQWGKSAKELRLRDGASRGSRPNSQSNSECTFKGKAQTSQPQRCGATSFGMAPANIAVSRGAQGTTSKSRKSRSRLSKHEEQPDAAAVILAGAAGISASTGNLPGLRGPLRKRNAAAQRDSIQSQMSQGTKPIQHMKSVVNIESVPASHVTVARQNHQANNKQLAGRERLEGAPLERQHQPSRSELNLMPKYSTKTREQMGVKLVGKQGSRAGEVDEGAAQLQLTPQKSATNTAAGPLGLAQEAGAENATAQNKFKHMKPLKSLLLPPENLGVEVAQIKKQAETSTKSEMLRRKKHQQLVNRASIDSCKQQSRMVNNILIGPLDKNVGQKLLGRYQLTTHPASSTNSATTKNVLSKEQIQLMRHFEKQQQIQQMQQTQHQQAIAHDLEKKAALADGKVSESKSKKKLLMTDQQSNNFNRKNVIENYFQIGNAAGKTMAPQEPARLRLQDHQSKPSLKARSSQNQGAKKSRDRSREKSIESRPISHGHLGGAATVTHAASYQLTVQGGGQMPANANIYTLGVSSKAQQHFTKQQSKKATSATSMDKQNNQLAISSKNQQRQGSLGSQLGNQVPPGEQEEAAAEDDEEQHLAKKALQAKLQNNNEDGTAVVRGSNGKQSKSQLNNQRQTLNINVNQMSEPSRKSNLALQRGKAQVNQVLKFENQPVLDEKAPGNGGQGSLPTSLSSQITPKSQNAIPKLKLDVNVKVPGAGQGGHQSQQKKGLLLKNLEKLARYQSLPEEALNNEASSSRTTNKKTQKTGKHRNLPDLHRREKNKSAEKLKKSAGVESHVNISRSKGSCARGQNHQATQKSLLHSSTSHLEQFSMSNEALSMIVNNQKKQQENTDDNVMLMIDDGGDQICTLGGGPPARIHWNEDAAITNLPNRTKAKKSNMKVVASEKQQSALGMQKHEVAATIDDASIDYPNVIDAKQGFQQQVLMAQKAPKKGLLKQLAGGFQGGAQVQLQNQHLKSQKQLQGGIAGSKKESLQVKAKSTMQAGQPLLNKNSSISNEGPGASEEKRSEADQRSDQPLHPKASKASSKKHHAHTVAAKKASAKIMRTRSKEREHQQAVTVKKNEPRASLQKQALAQVASLQSASLQGDTEAMKRQILENAKLLQFNQLLATTVQSPKDTADAKQMLQILGVKQAAGTQQNLGQGQPGVPQGTKAGDARPRQQSDLATVPKAALADPNTKTYKNKVLNIAGIGGSTMPANALAAAGLTLNQAPPLLKAKSHQATESKQGQFEEAPVAQPQVQGPRLQGQNSVKNKFQTVTMAKNFKMAGKAQGAAVEVLSGQPAALQNQVLLSNFSSLPLQIQQKQAMNLRAGAGKLSKAALVKKTNLNQFNTNEHKRRDDEEMVRNRGVANKSGLVQGKGGAEKVMVGHRVAVPLNTDQHSSPSAPGNEKHRRVYDVVNQEQQLLGEEDGLKKSTGSSGGWQWAKNGRSSQALASSLSHKGQEADQIEAIDADPLMLESMTMQQPPSSTAKQSAIAATANARIQAAAAAASQTNIGGVSLIGNQHVATASFGLTTTFLQSGGNLCAANTTASSNTLLLNNKSLNLVRNEMFDFKLNKD